MGKGSGGGSSGSTTVTTQPPQALLDNYMRLTSAGFNQAAQPLQQYGGQQVADFSSDQIDAFGRVRNAQGLATPYINTAAQYAGQGAAPIYPGLEKFSPEAIAKYTNPYNEDVVNSTIANLNENDASQANGLLAKAIGAGAFGGDRAGVAAGELARQQNLARGQTIGGLRQAGYTQATQQLNTQQQLQAATQQADQQRALAASQQFGNLGQQALSSELQGASAQLQTGALQQQQTQGNLDVPYQQFLERQAFPYQQLGWLANLVTGVGAQAGGQQITTPPKPSTLQQLGGLGVGGLALASLFVKRGGRIPHRASGGLVPGDINLDDPVATPLLPSIGPPGPRFTDPNWPRFFFYKDPGGYGIDIPQLTPGSKRGLDGGDGGGSDIVKALAGGPDIVTPSSFANFANGPAGPAAPAAAAPVMQDRIFPMFPEGGDHGGAGSDGQGGGGGGWRRGGLVPKRASGGASDGGPAGSAAAITNAMMNDPQLTADIAAKLGYPPGTPPSTLAQSLVSMAVQHGYFSPTNQPTPVTPEEMAAIQGIPESVAAMQMQDMVDQPATMGATPVGMFGYSAPESTTARSFNMEDVAGVSPSWAGGINTPGMAGFGFAKDTNPSIAGLQMQMQDTQARPSSLNDMMAATAAPTQSRASGVAGLAAPTAPSLPGNPRAGSWPGTVSVNPSAISTAPRGLTAQTQAPAPVAMSDLVFQDQLNDLLSDEEPAAAFGPSFSSVAGLAAPAKSPASASAPVAPGINADLVFQDQLNDLLAPDEPVGMPGPSLAGVMSALATQQPAAVQDVAPSPDLNGIAGVSPADVAAAQAAYSSAHPTVGVSVPGTNLSQIGVAQAANEAANSRSEQNDPNSTAAEAAANAAGVGIGGLGATDYGGEDQGGGGSNSGQNAGDSTGLGGNSNNGEPGWYRGGLIPKRAVGGQSAALGLAGQSMGIPGISGGGFPGGPAAFAGAIARLKKLPRGRLKQLATFGKNTPIGTAAARALATQPQEYLTAGLLGDIGGGSGQDEFASPYAAGGFVDDDDDFDTGEVGDDSLSYAPAGLSGGFGGAGAPGLPQLPTYAPAPAGGGVAANFVPPGFGTRPRPVQVAEAPPKVDTKTAALLGLAAAGFGMAASKSPYIGQAAGEGGLAGVGVFAKQKQQAENQAYRQQQLARQKAQQEAVERHYENMDSRPTVDHSGPTTRIYYPSEKTWIDTGIPTTAAQSAQARDKLATQQAQALGEQRKTQNEIARERLRAAQGQRGDANSFRQQELQLRRDELNRKEDSERRKSEGENLTDVEKMQKARDRAKDQFGEDDPRVQEIDQAIDKKTKGTARYTEFASKSAAFAKRMEDAESDLDKVTKAGYDPGGMRDKVAGNIPFVGNYAMSDEGQRYQQAQRSWVRANLRLESGAAIGKDEMEKEILTYFPQPGENAETIAQKAASRRRVQEAVKAQSQGAYDELFGDGKKKPPAPKKIATQADIADTMKANNMTREAVIERLKKDGWTIQ